MGTDVFTKEKRSEVMSAIRSKNTKPEIKVRKALHKLGYRFRLHRKDLPGKPDVVLPKYRMAVFVHGCKKSSVPKQNAEYWMTKLRRNVERDEKAVEELRKQGWEVAVIWECELEQGIKELVGRLGDVINNLRDRLPVPWIFVISIVVYCLDDYWYAPFTVYNFIFSACIGLSLTYAFYKTGSIWGNTGLHVGNNVSYGLFYGLVQKTDGGIFLVTDTGTDSLLGQSIEIAFTAVVFLVVLYFFRKTSDA